ncbi:hypothetical protein ACFQ2Y_12020 [Streptomyces malaysiensis subsp. malaysiensis]
MFMPPLQPRVCLAVLAERHVVEVEAVRGGGVPGTGGELPPELGVVLMPGQLEDTSQDTGAGRFEDAPGEEVPQLGQGVGASHDRLAQGVQVLRHPFVRARRRGFGGPGRPPGVLRGPLMGWGAAGVGVAGGEPGLGGLEVDGRGGVEQGPGEDVVNG